MKAFFRSLRIWLLLGMGVKRWVLLMLVASAMIGISVVYALVRLQQTDILPTAAYRIVTLQFLPVWLRIIGPILLGSAVIIFAVIRLSANVLAPFQMPDDDIAQSVYTHRHLKRGLRIVAIGGGTGMPSLLRGLIAHTSNITAVVTVADDGGSSGRLRRELGLLPPGDFRNNIAALAGDEALVTQLLQYRFGAPVGEGTPAQLQGHAFGNLMIAALAGITGSFDEALQAMPRVLAMRGTVMPSTLSNISLVAEIEQNGKLVRVVGESKIPETPGIIRQIMLEPQTVRAYPPVLRAIFQADLIVMGPGSLYTSIIPNLLLPEIRDALKLCKARKVYVCNVATQPGETDDFSMSDHVKALNRHLGGSVIDVVIANDHKKLATDLDIGKTVFVPLDEMADVEIIAADLTDKARPWRHNSAKVADLIVSLVDD